MHTVHLVQPCCTCCCCTALPVAQHRQDGGPVVGHIAQHVSAARWCVSATRSLADHAACAASTAWPCDAHLPRARCGVRPRPRPAVALVAQHQVHGSAVAQLRSCRRQTCCGRCPDARHRRCCHRTGPTGSACRPSAGHVLLHLAVPGCTAPSLALPRTNLVLHQLAGDSQRLSDARGASDARSASSTWASPWLCPGRTCHSGAAVHWHVLC